MAFQFLKLTLNNFLSSDSMGYGSNLAKPLIQGTPDLFR